MPFEAYIGYVAERDDEMAAGMPFIIEVRDLDTYERMIVRAVVARPGQPLEGSDKLWIVDWVEARQEDPWSIRVEEELDEEAVAAFRSDISREDLSSQADESKIFASGRGRGASMPQMMGGEEAKKFFENMAALKSGNKK
jgi:hypothetical protein